MRLPTLKTREQRILRDFRDALIGAVSLKGMMSDAFSSLSQLVPADRGALCVTKPGTTHDYFWELANVPPAWFIGYAEMEKHDLVRYAVLRRPNKVLCESDIASPRTFQENLWVQRSQELGMSLTHVMSVMLAKEPDWHGGITLYREERSAFSERQQSLLEHEVVPSLLQAISRCRRLEADVKPSRLLEWLFHHFRGMGVVVVVPPAQEVMRTEGTDALLKKWFLPHERRRGSLPSPLLEQFATVLRLSEGGTPPRDVWWDVGEHENLKVSFLQLPPEEEQPSRWAWILEEVPHPVLLPWNWREKLTEQEQQIFDCWRRARPRLALKERLTPREFETAQLSITGLEITTIAEELGCEPATVRVHLHNVYNKLGAENLAMLLSRAFRHR
jgi:DNA-binding CsgD family transcriptional regulator